MKLSIEERTYVLEELAAYVHINEQGRLDLDQFCCTLSSCFDFDEVLHLSPQPRDMFDLLVAIIQEEEGSEQRCRWVQQQKISDWKPEHARMYPDRIRTFIHISALVKHGHTWISEIGHGLMSLSQSETDREYYSWVKDEWFFTHLFIENYHNQLFEFCQKLDAQKAARGEVSSFEALFLATSKGIDYEEASEELSIRNNARSQAMARVELAISGRFFLEAITLEECIVSNCLFNYLLAKNEIMKEASLADLLKKMQRVNTNASQEVRRMFLEIDQWRASRNSSIHGFITTRTSELHKSTEEFLAFSEKTAVDGLSLTRQLLLWFSEESARFLPVRFPVPAGRSVQ
jgi:hypothetical protein